MLAPIIGENAGKIWQVLNEKGQTDINAIKKATSMDEKNLYMALGWLAREEKIKFEQKQRQILVNLTGK